MGLIKNQEGFTLIEVMTALVIGLVLIIAFSGAIVSSFKAEIRMDERMEASRITDSIIEQLQNKNLKNLDSNDIDDIQTNINNFVTKNLVISDSNTGNPDITVETDKRDDLNLYLVTINWSDRNYKIEVLLAGD